MKDRVECVIMEERDQALLLRQDRPNRERVEEWVPRSQVTHVSKRPKAGVEGVPAVVTMTQWICEKKGFYGVEV